MAFDAYMSVIVLFGGTPSWGSSYDPYVWYFVGGNWHTGLSLSFTLVEPGGRLCFCPTIRGHVRRKHVRVVRVLVYL